MTHLVFPIGEEHFHIQFAPFPQYAVLFALGCAAGRRGWLEALTPQRRRRCGIVGLIAVLVLPVLLFAGGFTESDAKQDLYAGGWHWQAAGISLLEASLAATLPLFLIGWFREKWTRQTPLLRWMGRRRLRRLRHSPAGDRGPRAGVARGRGPGGAEVRRGTRRRGRRIVWHHRVRHAELGGPCAGRLGAATAWEPSPRRSANRAADPPLTTASESTYVLSASKEGRGSERSRA